MHANALLLQRLFSSLDRRDHAAIAACYCSDATFKDIAFDLHGRKEIHDMWRMICTGDIRATFEVLHADDESGRVRLIDEYTFSDTGRKVRNAIDSRFVFSNHLIASHVDTCDARDWGAMALGGVRGFLAGRVGPLRRAMATRKLKQFVAEHATPV